jgi:ABC-2 type transport system ATP-binding protein
MLTGQLRPVEGRALILGEDISRSAKKIQQYLGVSFETANLYEEMSAAENLDLFARLFNVKGFCASALMEKVGLGGHERDRVATFSKGMKQRLMLARALINHPRILFLDEPTDGLDPVSSQTIHAIIRQAAGEGATVFLTTHDMLEADKLSQRVAFINQGKIAALDQPAVLKQRFGKRLLKVESEDGSSRKHTHNIPLDGADTQKEIERIFSSEHVLTAHTEEATLEDIFIEITGRGCWDDPRSDRQGPQALFSQPFFPGGDVTGHGRVHRFVLPAAFQTGRYHHDRHRGSTGHLG